MKQSERVSEMKRENRKEDMPSRIRMVDSFQPSGSFADRVMFLQRTIGNQAVDRMIRSGTLQTRLTIGQPGDKYEQEADRIADAVMQMPEPEIVPGKKPHVQRSCQVCEEKELNQNTRPGINISPFSIQQTVQRQETSFPDETEEKLKNEKHIRLKGQASSVAAIVMEHQLDAMTGSGRALPETIRMQMEERFGASFDHVRIHTDDKAAQMSHSLHAEAFTYGNDIYFGANRYDHSTKNGKGLLAHELTHTLQQTGISRKRIQRRGGATVGELAINSNVINAGLTAGHSWLAYTPVGGTVTTYGTWGNRTPKGLHRNLELGYTPAAIRRTNLDAGDYTALTSFVAANTDWGIFNNCASFAARGWRAVTRELLSYTNWLGIPNPSSLGEGIVAANGGRAGTLATTVPGTGPSSSGDSSTGSSTGSSGGSSTGSSGESSGSSL